MATLSQASRLADLPSAHDAFQGHAAHIIEWPTMLRPKDSEGTCIPSGVPTFLQTASRRNTSADCRLRPLHLSPEQQKRQTLQALLVALIASFIKNSSVLWLQRS